MAGSSFGQLFRITTFGESHGPAVGVVVDGVTPNVEQFLNKSGMSQAIAVDPDEETAIGHLMDEPLDLAA